jgi:PAS domain S-box-containing protein
MSAANIIGAFIKNGESGEELRKSEERFKFAVTAATDGFWDANFEEMTCYYSPRFEEILGYSPGEFPSIFQAFLNIIHPQDKDRVLDIVEGVYCDPVKNRFDTEFRILTKDNRTKWVLCRALILGRLKDSSPSRMIGVSIDIDKSKKQEQEIKKYNKKLEKSNEQLQQFAYFASHDLREPLRKIIAFSERIEEETPPDVFGEKTKDYFSRIKSASSRMQKLIDDLLSYSQVNSKDVEFIQVNLNELLVSVLDDLEVSIEKNKAKINVENLPTIEADPILLRQIFLNLVSNSLKFRKEKETPVISIKCKISQGECKIYVEDNGIGFNEKYLRKIFQVFQRLHSDKKYSGTGVGLAICKLIAERHNGDITATSIEGTGSTFIVTLPLKFQRNGNGNNGQR